MTNSPTSRTATLTRRLLNPVRLLVGGIGRVLAQLGLVDRSRAQQVADLAWPRIVTGLARMSKTAADVAMVGTALGAAAIAGVGYALPYWALAFALGGGVAGGTISLVAQRRGAGDPRSTSVAVTVSALAALAVTVPLGLTCAIFARPLIELIGTGDAAITYGTEYLQIAALAMPFGALNLIGSRTLVGANDAWTPMMVRAGGAVVNVVLSAFLIFVLDLGVTGAALGTLLANAAGTVAFMWGLIAGHLPGLGRLPVQIHLEAPRWDASTARHLTEIANDPNTAVMAGVSVLVVSCPCSLGIATPLALTNVVQSGGQFPLLAIVGLLGPDVVAAFVVALRMRDLMNTPGWGFGLASSSLVGQALGRHDEDEASAYATDTLRFAVAVYGLVAATVFVGATPLSYLFVDDPSIVPTTVALIRAACVAAVLWGVMNGALGPLRAGGDTRWPFYGRLLGLFAFALPVAYAGAVGPLGLVGLYLALILENGVPAAVTYGRFRSGKWRLISRAYRPTAG